MKRDEAVRFDKVIHLRTLEKTLSCASSLYFRSPCIATHSILSFSIAFEPHVVHTHALIYIHIYTYMNIYYLFVTFFFVLTHIVTLNFPFPLPPFHRALVSRPLSTSCSQSHDSLFSHIFLFVSPFTLIQSNPIFSPSLSPC